MSVAAVMLVKDEADIIETTVRHLLANVDSVYVWDNLSTDGTLEILSELALEHPGRLEAGSDDEVGYYQDRKTTNLAQYALRAGHRWVIPCDADEIWLADDGRRLADWFAGLSRETQFVKAAIYNHVATALDRPEERCPVCNGMGRLAATYAELTLDSPYCPTCDATGGSPNGQAEANPVRRIGWRQRQPLDIRWGKVACKLRPDLQIHMGNHSATTSGTGTTGGGLQIRHFPYRSADHFVRKAINGYAAYRATTMDESTGAHWRVYGRAIEEGGPEAGHAWFYDAFWSANPAADDTLVHDPCPI